jgi:hypothetical protein
MVTSIDFLCGVLRLNSVTFNLLRKLRRANLGVEDIEVANVGLHFSSESLQGRGVVG